MYRNKNNAGMLDGLLDQAFLELEHSAESEMILDAAAAQVMLSPMYTVKGMKKSFFGKPGLKTIFLLATVSIAVVCSLILITNERKVPEAVKNITAVTEDTAAEIRSERPVLKTENFLRISSVNENKKGPVEENKILLSLNPDTAAAVLDLHQYEAPAELKDMAIVKTVVEDSAYVFPTLTEKEIKANNKQKKKMIEQLMKFSKAKYGYAPTGSFQYNNTTLSIYGFYMQANEVTNLEYRTFLFDLLIQQRKEEFLIAKPDQQQWMKEFNRVFFQQFVDNYFSHPAYNEYPAANMSRKGAELYCIWLTSETNKVLAEKNKPLINDVRLPTDAEWTYAALAGHQEAVYPWIRDFVRSPRNGCFMANFCLFKYSGTLDSIKLCNPKAFTEAYTTGGLMLGEGTYPVPVYSYNPNDYGLYCMAGNVAEMVYVYKDLNSKQHTPGTKGGGWNSSDKNIRILGEDEYAGKINGVPYIGFRPVISANKIK